MSYTDTLNEREIPECDMPRECYFAGKIDAKNFLTKNVFPRFEDIPAKFIADYVNGYVDFTKEYFHV